MPVADSRPPSRDDDDEQEPDPASFIYLDPSIHRHYSPTETAASTPPPPEIWHSPPIFPQSLTDGGFNVHDRLELRITPPPGLGLSYAPTPYQQQNSVLPTAPALTLPTTMIETVVLQSKGMYDVNLVEDLYSDLSESYFKDANGKLSTFRRILSRISERCLLYWGEALAKTKENAATDLAKVKEIAARDLAKAKEIGASDLAKAKEIAARDLAKAKEIAARDLAKAKDELAKAKEVAARDLAKAKEIAARDLAKAKEIAASDLAKAKDELAEAKEEHAKTKEEHSKTKLEHALTKEIAAMDLGAKQQELGKLEADLRVHKVELQQMIMDNEMLQASLRSKAFGDPRKTHVAKHLISVTHTESWKKLAEHVMNCSPGTLPSLAGYKFNRSQTKDMKDKLEKVAGEELKLYAPTYEFLQGVFRKGPKVFKTTGTPFLADTAPDFVFCLPHTTEVQSWAVYGVLELKAVEASCRNLNSNKNLGQLANYLLRLAALQPERTEFWGVLSNIKDSTVLIMQCYPDSPFTFKRFTGVKFQNVISFILKKTSYDACPTTVPTLLPFKKELGQYYQRWANSQKWVVAEFAVPKDTEASLSGQEKKLKNMIVKASVSNGAYDMPEKHHFNERDHLRLLRAIRPAPPASIPRLVWEPEDDDDDLEGGIQFGIQPVGCEFNVNVFTTTEQFADGMGKLLEGLNWLHTEANLIHRDVRQSNVVYSMELQTPVLIDYDSAWKIQKSDSNEQVKTIYIGGIICIPKRVLNDLKAKKGTKLSNLRYTPKPADDLCAYLLLVLALIYEGRFQLFRDYDILSDGSEGQKRVGELQRLLEDVDKSTIWGPWWRCAEAGDAKGLEKMVSEVAIWPSLRSSVAYDIREADLEALFNTGP